MRVDVLTEIEIDRPRGQVATYAADPDNATAWYANIESIEWRTERPVTLGSKVAFVAGFLDGASPTPTRSRRSLPVSVS